MALLRSGDALSSTQRRRPSFACRVRLAALALSAFGVVVFGQLGPAPARAATPTPAPSFSGHHLNDDGHLFSPKAQDRAEALAAEIEAADGGRVMLYTSSDANPPATAVIGGSPVDGLLLTGSGTTGNAILGHTLASKLSPEQASLVRQYLPGSYQATADWMLSALARVDAFLHGKHVFDGSGILDDAGRRRAEAAAARLSGYIGYTTYVDIVAVTSGRLMSVAGDDAWGVVRQLSGTVVIGFGVSGDDVGAQIEQPFVSAKPVCWSYGSWDDYNGHLYDRRVGARDLQAFILEAIDAVQPAANLPYLFDTARDTIASFLSDPVNATFSLVGVLVGGGSLIVFVIARWRRRREPAFADDESVILPAPPPDMTPALAAMVAYPRHPFRAVTTALLDLAAHGRIAFFDYATALQTIPGITVLPASAQQALRPRSGAISLAQMRPLGAGEEWLMQQLRSVAVASSDSEASFVGFHDLRPAFSEAGFRLRAIAAERGWLTGRTHMVSWPWLVYGLMLLLAGWAAFQWGQPIAGVGLTGAGLVAAGGGSWMPRPLRTSMGAMTRAMVNAYRRTLRRALEDPGNDLPPWIANAEEAALWGYAWGIEGNIQSSIGKWVRFTMQSGFDPALHPDWAWARRRRQRRSKEVAAMAAADRAPDPAGGMGSGEPE